MSPGRSRRPRANLADRYNPWALSEPEPEPEARNPAQARTWAEFWALIPTGYNARIPSPPYRLDWQRNPKAPLPAGYALVRCLCGWTIVREPDARPRPRVTIGSKCDDCHAPMLRIKDRTESYRPPEGWKLYGCLCHRFTMYRVNLPSDVPPALECDDCGAPFQPLEHSNSPYEIDLELPPQPGAREFWRALGSEAWAFGDVQPEM